MDLHGRRILVVEDELIVAIDLEAMLERAGAAVVGPVGTVAEALDVLRKEPIDGALLDMNLHGESAAPVADALIAAEIRFVFVTAYARDPVPERHRVQPLVGKPYSHGVLLSVLHNTLTAPRAPD